MEARVIMLTDLDYFFAQCEERRNPSLKDKPIVVCVYSGRTEDSGAVSTANYVARKYGVKSGMPIFLAKTKLRNVDAVFLPMDRAYYEEVSDNVMRILERYADHFEQVGIDEAYLDMTRRTQGSYDSAEHLAQQMKSEVKAQEALTFSVGIGPNKLVAKIAADFHKPDGITVVKSEQVEAFLAPLPVNRLIGVGKKTSERMESLGIKTFGDLARYDIQGLMRIFGKRLGTYFHNASLGIDEAPVQERGEAESISRIITLKEDTLDFSVVAEKISQLCEDIHARLIQESLSFKSVGVSATLTDMSIHNRSRTFENPTKDLEVLKKTANELFRRLLSEVRPEARRVGVKVSNFAREQETQKHLTDFVSPTGRSR